MTSARDSRQDGAARALAVSWVAVSLSVLAHLVAGGSVPAPAALLLLGTILALAGTPLSRSRFEVLSTGPLLVLQQLVVHVVLTISTPHPGDAHPTARLAASLESPHAGHLGTTPGSTVGTDHAAMAGHAVLPSPGMLAAHICAALAVAALLSRTETDLHRIVGLTRAQAWLGTRLRSVITTHVTADRVPRVEVLAAGLPWRRTLRDRVAPVGRAVDLWRTPAPCRRGPPVACAA